MPTVKKQRVDAKEETDFEVVVNCKLIEGHPEPLISCQCKKCSRTVKQYPKTIYDEKNLVKVTDDLTLVHKEIMDAWSRHRCVR